MDDNLQVDELTLGFEQVKCDKCGESYYRENYSTRTAMYWAPTYKNGKLINSNPNKTTVHCTCLNCGNDFCYQIGGSDVLV